MWIYVDFYVWLCGYVFDYVAMIVIVFICFYLFLYMFDNVVFNKGETPKRGHKMDIPLIVEQIHYTPSI
mgnify:CR=1 FL=1